MNVFLFLYERFEPDCFCVNEQYFYSERLERKADSKSVFLETDFARRIARLAWGLPCDMVQ
jgi:hypothetical protein